MYEYYSAAWHFPRLEVRNFAAIRISEILKTSDDPIPTWTKQDSASFRDRMRAEVKRELADSSKK
jgi:hypothetical protein